MKEFKEKLVIKMSGIADGLDVRVKEKKNQR
jgi:hypothetical protein